MKNLATIRDQIQEHRDALRAIETESQKSSRAAVRQVFEERAATQQRALDSAIRTASTSRAHHVAGAFRHAEDGLVLPEDVRRVCDAVIAGMDKTGHEDPRPRSELDKAQREIEAQLLASEQAEELALEKLETTGQPAWRRKDASVEIVLDLQPDGSFDRAKGRRLADSFVEFSAASSARLDRQNDTRRDIQALESRLLRLGQNDVQRLTVEAEIEQRRQDLGLLRDAKPSREESDHWSFCRRLDDWLDEKDAANALQASSAERRAQTAPIEQAYPRMAIAKGPRDAVAAG